VDAGLHLRQRQVERAVVGGVAILGDARSQAVDARVELRDMISLDDCSTFDARSFTASATTAKPAPASPARLASTVALNATRRVCSAICVMSAAARATSRSEVTTPSTPSPTCATASRAWAMATRLAPPLASMARLDCTIACMSAASWPISVTWPLLAATTSSMTPSSSAAPRPSSAA
jgi:hypothetical protein